ncbi:pYEATS domain-containing protein [Chryseobacterium sp. JUb7]|uniref:pYEATS domain-containing protein n=1 Tax=Chryseobacterium sp. JUb7 TaxID=2940599 RepID=UPI00216A9A7A|nr:pYEATS domain-containing protein [Chryseobacterium sp. JUb7]MCS3529577.1 hypothetical protein [Chryseobacterium sp. JUb7]
MKELVLKQKNRDLKSIWDFLLISIIVGIVICFLVGLHKINNSLTIYLELSGAFILIGGASFGIGGLSGFLFGVPKILNPEINHIDIEKKRKIISQNDNLVQISDWLTKIIVGVGLTQLNNIPGYLNSLGKYFSGILKDNTIGPAIIISIILYFLIIGFLSVYLWTRIHFIGMVKNVEDNLEEKLEEQEQKVKAIAEAVNDTQQKMTDIGGGKKITENMEAVKANINRITESDSDDPQKGKWGGLSETNERKVTAKVELSDIPTLYKVILEVMSTNPNNPLTGFVKFHLHPSFNNSEPMIAVTDGTATLLLNTVYGAFTAGIEVDEGKTQLEIDLAELPNIPQEFRDR